MARVLEQVLVQGETSALWSDGRSRNAAGGGLCHAWTNTPTVLMKFYSVTSIIWSYYCSYLLELKNKALWKRYKIRERNGLLL